MGSRVIWNKETVIKLREGLRAVGANKPPRDLDWLGAWKSTYISEGITYFQVLTKVYRERREYAKTPELPPWFIPLLRQAMKNESGEGVREDEREEKEEEKAVGIKSPVFDVSRAEQLLNRIGAVAADTLECREFSWYSRVKAGALIAEAIKLLNGE